jgi:hypothetical protein
MVAIRQLWSERTVETCERALRAFGTTPLTKAGLSAWVVSLRQERGLSVTTTNIMTRAVSSYLSWLHTESHHREWLRIKQLPNPPKPIKVLSDGGSQRAGNHAWSAWNLHPLVCVDVPEEDPSVRCDKGFRGLDGISMGGDVAHWFGMAEVVLAGRDNCTHGVEGVWLTGRQN